jgi:hypothetical protein
MKKIVLISFFTLLSLIAYSQKKKVAPVAKVSPVLAKVDNLVAEIKSGVFQISILEGTKQKDFIVVKNVDAKFKATNCQLKAFTSNGAKLYLLTWTETVQIKTDLKTEDLTTIYSVVYEINSKKQVFSNTQITNKITEKVFLDRLKTASETQERIRREGFEFILNPDGSVTQKNKTQSNKLIYNIDKMEFIDSRKK